MGERLYGLDWLRIGAFGLLILYHIGMFFVPWDWHIKTAAPVEWLETVMLAINPWRLSLLFLISGTASAFLLAKVGRPGGFARSRTARLLIPLFAGMVLFVPPQPWVELTVQHGYAQDYWQFWTRDYFRFGKLNGLDLPTWNHLWFVAYLWAYTMVLALAATALPDRAKVALLRGGEAVFGGWRVLALPVLLLWALRMTLFPIFSETHGLVDDWYNHASYGLVFATGLLLAHSTRIKEAFATVRWAALALAALGYAGVIAFNWSFPDDGPEPSAVLLGLARLAGRAEAWGAIAALVGFALNWKVGDSPARRYLTDAIFPYYIAHQTIIVLVAFWLRPFGLSNGALFALLVLATMAGCALSYELARRSGPLRPLFGLKLQPRKARNRSASVGDAGPRNPPPRLDPPAPNP
jgi:glucans biosynthesis protein C